MIHLRMRPSSVARKASRLIVLAALSTSFSACADRDGPSEIPDSAADTSVLQSQPVGSVTLIDTAIAPAIAGANGWNYSQSTSADLTGDGVSERIVLTAQVEMRRGAPLWDDGQAWQVYIEFPDSSRTYVYANRLQLGTLGMRLSRADSAQRASIILVEHLPDRLRIAEVTLSGERRPTTRVMFERNLDPTGDIAVPLR